MIRVEHVLVTGALSQSPVDTLLPFGPSGLSVRRQGVGAPLLRAWWGAPRTHMARGRRAVRPGRVGSAARRGEAVAAGHAGRGERGGARGGRAAG